MNKTKTLSLIILAISAFGLVVFFASKTSTQKVTDNKIVDNLFQDDVTLLQKPEPTDLFVHSAKRGYIEQIEGEEDKYIVTLTDFDDDVVYFTDRPLHDTGRVKLAQFLDGLGFEIGNPPNAAIVAKLKNGEEITVVVELTNPILDRDAKELMYTATILHDEKGNDAEYGTQQLSGKITQVTMLIDGCGKKGEKFCGSTGQCYNPKKENCGGVATWKHEKGKKCHGLKLEDAYKFANGSDSECLLHDKASLSQIDYKCDDNLKAWKIGLDANFKGEQSGCKAYCIVLANESHKKGEGVARIEYECKKTSDEKEPKNKYCPKPDLNKGYDNENARKNLIDEYHHILDKATKHHTSYEHHYCVATGMPYNNTKKHWATDCSGLGGFALFKSLPYHYKLLDESRHAWKKADRPLASDFYEYIKNIKDDNKCWERIHELKNAKQGDFLVVKYDERAGENSTGHVMWINKAPEWHDIAQHYEVEVIDSANNGHGDDTRDAHNTYNCEGKKNCGIGKGSLTIYAKDGKDGGPERYKWNTKFSSDQYVPYKKDCPDSKKCRLEGIVIGRVKDCKVKK